MSSLLITTKVQQQKNIRLKVTRMFLGIEMLARKENLVVGRVLRLKTQSIKSIKESYISINIRELNGVSKYKLSILYILDL